MTIIFHHLHVIWYYFYMPISVQNCVCPFVCVFNYKFNNSQGDSLTTTCMDSTANRKNVVLVGNASTHTKVNLLPMVASDCKIGSSWLWIHSSQTKRINIWLFAVCTWQQYSCQLYYLFQGRLCNIWRNVCELYTLLPKGRTGSLQEFCYNTIPVWTLQFSTRVSGITDSYLIKNKYQQIY